MSGNVDFHSHVDQAGAFDWWVQDKKQDEKGYVTHLITRHAVRFIEEHRDRPFLLYLPHEAPHYPFQGPNDPPLRSVGKPRTRGEGKKIDTRRAYREMVQEMDRGIGEIVATLKKHGLEKRTLVIFCSDNGAARWGSNKPLRGNKGQVWEGGHRVPAIAWQPGKIKAGAVNDSLCISMDWMPTMLALAGVEPPKDRPLDGIDLSPVLLDNKEIKDRRLFWAHGGSRAMRDGPWKLITGSRRGGGGLFNLEKDLGEAADLSKQQADRAAAMRQAIEKWHTEVTEGATPQPDAAASSR